LQVVEEKDQGHLGTQALHVGGVLLEDTALLNSKLSGCRFPLGQFIQLIHPTDLLDDRLSQGTHQRATRHEKANQFRRRFHQDLHRTH
jgi:hypothetical protein